MRVISNRALIDFAGKHTEAGEPLQAWRRVMESSDFQHFAALRTSFNHVDKAGDYHVFAIGGNKWRVIAFIHFPAQLCCIKHVLTHQEYDRWQP